MEKLKEQGWYLSDHGYNLASDSGNITDVQKIIKHCIDLDLREISSGEGSISQGNIVLQIQKLRNVSAPKNNEESRTAPRMLKLSLTDGKNNFQAVEVEHIPSISLNTPPGTKLLMKSGNPPMSHGVILIRPSCVGSVLGGRVANLVEKWELNKKLASHTRVRSAEEGGPPPWIPFGKKIIKVIDSDKNFKALAEKEKPTKENTEFEAQRKDAIAEAAKQGCKKVFGGGNKQLLDHGVQKIVDQGFSIEQAEYALRINRNNVDKALRSLQRTDSKNNLREPRESREPRGKRFEKKVEESKPSSGKISLFDFLEDKLPVQHSVTEIIGVQQNSRLQNTDGNYARVESKSIDGPSSRNGRSQKGGREYQAPQRHLEENKNIRRVQNNSSLQSQYSQYNGGNGSLQNRPPRFQRNQDNQNYCQQDNSNRSGYQRSLQIDGYRNSYTQAHTDEGNNSNNASYSKNQQDHQGKSLGNSKTYGRSDSDARNRQSDVSYSRHMRAPDGTHGAYTANTTDKNYKNQQNRYQPNDNTGGRGAVGPNNQRSESHFNSSQHLGTPTSGSWVWRIGDKCLAKYWEDNRYYNAKVTAVSERTCVVQFKGFENYEEVLQADCLPITEDDQDIQESGIEQIHQDQRFNNRPPRHDQSHNHISAGMEFRRGGNGVVPGTKGYGKKRGQRSAQPIYQPPAQRSHNAISTNTQNNPN